MNIYRFIKVHVSFIFPVYINSSNIIFFIFIYTYWVIKCKTL